MILLVILGVLDILASISLLIPNPFSQTILIALSLKGIWSLSMSRDVLFITLSLIDILTLVFFILNITLIIRILAIILFLKGLWSLF